MRLGTNYQGGNGDGRAPYRKQHLFLEGDRAGIRMLVLLGSQLGAKLVLVPPFLPCFKLEHFTVRVAIIIAYVFT
eukprot:scaffold8483_cov78-Skeletonema_dohrnii-CCMP3373.AAC.2